MQLVRLAGAMAAAVAVNAQDNRATTAYTTTAPMTSETAAPKTHTIGVAAAGFTFTPAELKANVGDTIVWRFYPKVHSVVRAPFKNPCIPYEYTEVHHKGFSSGLRYVEAILNDPPTYSIVVNDTEPIFYYCSAPDACTHDHMVGVINPNSTWTLDIQRQFAQNATLQLNPGDPWPEEGPGKTPTAAPLPKATGSADTPPPSGTEALSGGAIAGIAVGGTLAVIAVGALLFWWGRRRGKREEQRRSYGRDTVGSPLPQAEMRYDGGAGGMGLGVGKPGGSPGQATWSTTSGYGVSHDRTGSTGTSGVAGAAGAAAYNVASAGAHPIGHQSTGQPFPSPGLASPYSSTGGYPANVRGSGDAAEYYAAQQQAQGVMPTGQSHAIGVAHGHPPGEPVNSPVELPASQDPGNSPLPDYAPESGVNRHFSWSQNAEQTYRPEKS